MGESIVSGSNKHIQAYSTSEWVWLTSSKSKQIRTVHSEIIEMCLKPKYVCLSAISEIKVVVVEEVSFLSAIKLIEIHDINKYNLHSDWDMP